jgi:hypothetical protein
MKLGLIGAASLVACLPHCARGAAVYVISSGDVSTDAAAVNRLTSAGFQVHLGVDFSLFDGSVNLGGIDAVYLQNNYNWTSGSLMPAAGQQQLINWVNGGGRLVTSEWVLYYCYPGGRFGTLASIVPAASSGAYAGNTTATLTRVTADVGIDAGVPATFTCPLVSYGGTEIFTTARAGATTYFTTGNAAAAAALVGWGVGQGSVYSFTSTCGPAQLADASFGTLFTNAFSARRCGSADFNCDGDSGTDLDIETFFACLAGTCPPPPCPNTADFNGDGDVATDADIEAFFRVLAGGEC